MTGNNNEYIDALKEQADRASNLLKEHNQANQEQDGEEASEQDGPAQPLTIGRFFMKNLIYILSVAVVVVIVALGVIIVSPFFSDITDEEQLEESYVSPYDWTKLTRNDGRYAYIDGGQTKSRLGIDVSENQHWIDWGAVGMDGIDFAMIRLGYRGATAGDLYMDEYYPYNVAGATAAGLDIGVYFFSQARTPEEAVQEADFVLANLGDVALSYPIAFDSEERVIGIAESRTAGLDADAMTAVAEAFCARIEEAGLESMIYGNAHDLSRYRRSSLEGERLWWAEYGAPLPTAKLDIELWQYSNAGRVSGIDGEVDMDLDLKPILAPDDRSEEDAA